MQESEQQSESAGGPKTAEGKAVVRLNAVKHGILSKEAVITRGDLKESAEEYEELRDLLFAEVQPVGIIETMLTDKLFTLYWRERRVVKMERAAVELRSIGQKVSMKSARIKPDKLFPSETEMQVTDWLKLHATAECLLAFVEEGDVPFPAEVEKELNMMMLFPEIDEERLALGMQNILLKGKVERGEMTDPSQRRAALLDPANKLLQKAKEILDDRERNERDEDDATVECRSLPDPESAQRIQRYESYLSRSFLATLHELQRVQAARKGNVAPLTAALDVTVEGKEGFVS